MTAPIRRYFPEKERQLRRSMAIHMPSHNVLDFGMPPGTTDSSSKFRDLLAAVEDGASIFFPNGTWTFTDATGITLERPVLLHLSAGTVLRFTGDSFLFVNGDSITIRGEGWGSIIDMSATSSQGIVVGDDITDPVDVIIDNLQLLGSGAANSAAIFPVSCSRCTFNLLLINDWVFGFDGGGADGVSQSLFAHNTFVSTTAAGRLFMLDCRFTDNTDIGGSAAFTESTGSDRNVFAGNKFASPPLFVGANSVCREHANIGTDTLVDTIANSQAAWNGISVTVSTELIRVTRNSGAGNFNFDKILTLGGGVVAPIGRRISVVVENNDATDTVTVRDNGTSAAGTGGFELDQRFGQTLVVPAGDEWYFAFVVNQDQTRWVEVARARMDATGVFTIPWTNVNHQMLGGLFFAEDGSQGAPTYSFDADRDTGRWWVSDGIMADGVNNVEKIRYSSWIDGNAGAKQTLFSNLTTSGAVTAPDLSVSNIFRYLLTGNVTDFPVPNEPDSASGESAVVTIIFKQDGTGTRTVVFASGWHFPGGGDPTISSAANAVDVVSAVYDPVSNVWYASIMQDVKA